MSTPPEEGAWLEAADGTRHPIKGSCSLGRTAANTIVLESPKVSRRHALVHLQNIGELWLIDFGSSNGTFLNKRRIQAVAAVVPTAEPKKAFAAASIPSTISLKSVFHPCPSVAK